MVYHKCLFCSEDTMHTRKKAMSRSHVHRCNTESAEISKDKKLKLQQKDEIEPTKRSRGKRNAPVDMPNPPIQRKRKNETADPKKDKKLKTFKKGQNEHVKAYCWICHKLAQGRTCTCKRVYHNECLEKASKAFENNKCPECQLQSVNGTELTRPFVGGLKVYLESAAKWITEKHKDKLLSWPQNSDIIPAFDIETLLKKVQKNSYKTTAEFYADVKWFYHNCCVLYGEHSKHTKDMKKVINEFKEELFDMEACPECYYHLYIHKSEDSNNGDSEKAENSINGDFFVRLCNPPHDIVWAKVSGYSHFPAKCLKVINNKARVRFFGKHEKSDIPINTIFRISQEHPVYKNKNITDAESRSSLEYTYARREFLRYITMYEEKVGDFQFFGFRVFFDPDCVSSKARKETYKPGFFTPSPMLIPTCETTIPSSNNDISVNMTFCVDNHTPDNSTSPLESVSHIQENGNSAGRNTSSENPYSNAASACISPVSSMGSFSTISTCSTADFHDFQIKQELPETNQISSLAESSNETPIDVMQIFRNALMRSSSFPATGESTSSTESFLASMSQNCYSHDNPEKAISPSISVPHSPIIKKEYDLPSTSEVCQININSTESASTIGDQQLPEPEVDSSSSNFEIAVIDLTEDNDNTPNMRLSNLLEENPRIRNLFECTHKVFDTFVTRLCEEVFKQQTPEPNQMCRELANKLNETEKKFQEETEKLRDEIQSLQKSLGTEK